MTAITSLRTARGIDAEVQETLVSGVVHIDQQRQKQDDEKPRLDTYFGHVVTALLTTF